MKPVIVDGQSYGEITMTEKEIHLVDQILEEQPQGEDPLEKCEYWKKMALDEENDSKKRAVSEYAEISRRIWCLKSEADVKDGDSDEFEEVLEEMDFDAENYKDPSDVFGESDKKKIKIENNINANEYTRSKFTTLIHLLEKSIAICGNKKPDISLIIENAINIEGLINDYKDKYGFQDATSGPIEQFQNKCSKYIGKIDRIGNGQERKKKYFEAAKAYKAITIIDNSNKKASKKHKELRSVISELSPERIRKIHIQKEGEGIIGYFSLVNKKGKAVSFQGKLYLHIYLTSGGKLGRPGHYWQTCYKYQATVNNEDFEIAAIGLGLFQRGALIHRIPYIKWSEFKCEGISWHQRFQRLKSLPSDVGFAAEITFAPMVGKNMKATEYFRP